MWIILIGSTVLAIVTFAVANPKLPPILKPEEAPDPDDDETDDEPEDDDEEDEPIADDEVVEEDAPIVDTKPINIAKERKAKRAARVPKVKS